MPLALPRATAEGRDMRGAILTVVLVAVTGTMGAAQDGRLTVELNKFEDGVEGEGCRAFFLFRNDTGAAFEGFEMSLAILDPRGVIDRLLTIDAAPLPADRTTLKLFEIPQTACADISEVLLHDVSVCKPQNAPDTDCFALMDLASLTSAPLVK
jgi:hypothetical protein